MNVQTFREPLTVKKVVQKEKAQKAFISHFLAKKRLRKWKEKGLDIALRMRCSSSRTSCCY